MANNNNGKKGILGFEHWQVITIYLAIYDVLAVTLAYFLALLLRFDFAFSHIPILYLQTWAVFAPFYAVICLIVFSRARLYRSIWRFASFTELQRIVVATVITTVLHIIGTVIVIDILVRGTPYSTNRMPLSYIIIGSMIQFALIVAVRFSYRYILLLRASRDKKAASNIMLIGAGSAGQMILRDITDKIDLSTLDLSESAEDADYQFLAPFPTANDYKLTCSTNRRSVGAHKVTFKFHRQHHRQGDC